MSERRHRSALHHPDPVAGLGAAGESAPGKLGSPAGPKGDRGEPLLEGAAQAGLGADMAGQMISAPGPDHVKELIACGLGVGHHRETWD